LRFDFSVSDPEVTDFRKVVQEVLSVLFGFVFY